MDSFCNGIVSIFAFDGITMIIFVCWLLLKVHVHGYLIKHIVSISVADGIPPQQLMETVEQASIPLARVFNLSLKEGVVPFEWKEANIIPLFKKGQEISQRITDQ